MTYVAPKSFAASFTCTHCGVYAQQTHHASDWTLRGGGQSVRTSQCMHCAEWCLWCGDRMVHPNRGNAPPPNPDMPADVKKEYEEAASVCQQSPRGAAALLRLAVQKLCSQLEPEAKSINEAVGRLVRNGLPAPIQKSLDIVRVTGNNAVHPGEINTDDIEVAGRLFPLLNVIVDFAISFPARIAETYETLPEGAKEAIEKRDS